MNDSIAYIVDQFVPAGSNFDPDIYNTIESHVLERNKYKTQFPTIEFKQPEPIGQILGINEMDYNWRLGHVNLSSY